jgi:hypothetical protein
MWISFAVHEYEAQCNSEDFYCKNLYKEQILSKSVITNSELCFLAFCILWINMCWLVNKFWSKASWLEKKQEWTLHFFQEETLDDVGMRLEASWKSWWYCQRNLVHQSHLHMEAQNLCFWDITNLHLCRNSERHIALPEYGYVTGSLKQCVVLRFILF